MLDINHTCIIVCCNLTIRPTWAIQIKKMNNMNFKALWIKFEKYTTVITFKKFERHNYARDINCGLKYYFFFILLFE